MKIFLYYIGREKKDHFTDAIQVYVSRLKHYCQFEIKQIIPQKYPNSYSIKKILSIEAELLKLELKSIDQVVLLDEQGKQISSETMAKMIQNFQNRSLRKLAFVLGGSFGFDSQFKSKFNNQLSLSKLTFPHHLAKLIFTEQLYRAFTILNGEPYHNF